MNRAVSLVGAAGIGAGLMYLLDPDRGKRRRALIRDKAKRINRRAIDAVGKKRRDLGNHLRGTVSEIGSLVRSDNVIDDVIEARVRSKLGRVVSHPHAIHTKVKDGLVTLSGRILANEVLGLCDAVVSIAGVKNIENQLELHEEAGNIPALQG